MKPRPATAGDLKVPTPKTNNDDKGNDSNTALIVAVGMLLLSNAAWILYTVKQQRRFTVQLDEKEKKYKTTNTVENEQKSNKIINS